MGTKSGTPSLNVKALAEMLLMPAYEQSRLLHDQKYPKHPPQIFRTPYYQRAIAGIREYFRSDNDSKVVQAIQNDLQNIGDLTRRKNNLRVIENFLKSSQVKRKLQPLPNTKHSAMTGAVEVRLSADLQALENDGSRIIYFNCRIVPVPDEIARLTVEVANWVLTQSHVEIPYEQVELVDLANGKVHRQKKGRPSTVKAIKNNGKIIEALWAAI
jgi:hypothetical protein